MPPKPEWDRYYYVHLYTRKLKNKGLSHFEVPKLVSSGARLMNDNHREEDVLGLM